MSTNTFTANKRQAKSIRLVGTLTIDVNGTPVQVSTAFKLQTDLAYSGMSVAEQDTVLNAYKTALVADADINFSLQLKAEEIKSAVKTSKEPSALDLILAEINKPSPEDMLEAVLRDDVSKEGSTQAALDILGVTSLPDTLGSK